MGKMVRPGLVAIVAGLVVAIYVVTLYLVRPVPDRMIHLLGGPAGGVDRVGGLRVQYRPPASASPEALERLVAGRATIRREDDVLVLEYPRLAAESVDDVIDVLAEGGLEMREALESDTFTRTGLPILREPDPSAVSVDVDQWRPEDGAPAHLTYYVTGPTREAVEASLRDAAAKGWTLPPGSSVGYERVEPYAGERAQRASWRTYELAHEVLIDGTMIANAVGSYDPNTNRPIILLEFTKDGGQRFCDVTEHLVGKKLATVLGGRVRSAPIINGRICGGRASITMGGSDPQRQERERDALISVLSQGAVPPGGVIVAKELVPPADVHIKEWIARLLFGLVAGALFGLLTFVVVRYARPRWLGEAAVAIDGRFPWRRLAVTLLAPISLFLGSNLTLPGINDVELAHVLRGASDTKFTVIALGIMPIISSFILVEIVALAVPRLRWRRHDPRGRVGLGIAVAVVAVLVALVQAYFYAVYLEQLSAYGAEVVLASGWKLRLAIMGSLGAGTILLAVIAGMIREHGLGNGYGALLLSGVVLSILDPYIHAGLSHLPEALSAYVTRDVILGAIMLLAIGAVTACVLRWQIAEREGEHGMRVPSSGVAPLSAAPAIATVIGLLAALGLGDKLGDALFWAARLRTHVWIHVAVVVATIPLWCWLFAAPRRIERVSLASVLDRTTHDSWRRSLAVSALLVVTVFALWTIAVRTSIVAGSLTDAVSMMLCTAVVLDMIGDARAYRQPLVPAAVIHQIQQAEVAERVLADAGIPWHIHAGHLRTLLAFFGPFAPAVVLVPPAYADEARIKLDDALRAPAGTIPAARIAAP